MAKDAHLNKPEKRIEIVPRHVEIRIRPSAAAPQRKSMKINDSELQRKSKKDNGPYEPMVEDSSNPSSRTRCEPRAMDPMNPRRIGRGLVEPIVEDSVYPYPGQWTR